MQKYNINMEHSVDSPPFFFKIWEWRKKITKIAVVI